MSGCVHTRIELRRVAGAWRATCPTCEAWATTLGQLDHPRLALLNLTGGRGRYQPTTRKPADARRAWTWRAVDARTDAADAA